ncbi:hypothetical protein [Flavisphingopyxis soli]|uniref:hypothetical protein n=1 Tax=Flavisphingopyxis soli TaxID=2601267 RepID=UPI0013755306|nr:hypothetical protein [Sphingorhabdus soli]
MSRAAKIVANHGGFFDRLAGEGASCTTKMLEKFARFLVDPANWPGPVPQEVCDFAHAVGVSAPTATASSGKREAISPADHAQVTA